MEAERLFLCFCLAGGADSPEDPGAALSKHAAEAAAAAAAGDERQETAKATVSKTEWRWQHSCGCPERAAAGVLNGR